MDSYRYVICPAGFSVTLTVTVDGSSTGAGLRAIRWKCTCRDRSRSIGSRGGCRDRQRVSMSCEERVQEGSASNSLSCCLEELFRHSFYRQVRHMWQPYLASDCLDADDPALAQKAHCLGNSRQLGSIVWVQQPPDFLLVDAEPLCKLHLTDTRLAHCNG